MEGRNLDAKVWGIRVHKGEGEEVRIYKGDPLQLQTIIWRMYHEID